ncbi:MAG: NmrA family NAD(P)-binding protein [Hyphomonadaceae bacterium]
MARRAVVIGAGGAVGEAIAARLCGAGVAVLAAMRGSHPDAEQRLRTLGAEIVKIDLLDDASFAPALTGADIVIATPILTLSRRLAGAAQAAGVKRAVFFSSNNVAVDGESPVYAELRAAEGQVRAALPGAVILRPTLVYGDPRLPALPRLIRLMRRTPICPLPGRGKALQQPVFFEDLASFAAAAALGAGVEGKTFALGGPEAMSLKAMYQAVSDAAGGRRLILPVPRWALLALLAGGVRLPLDSDQVRRADVDKLARPVDPPPAAFSPKTPFKAGLVRLISALT